MDSESKLPPFGAILKSICTLPAQPSSHSPSIRATRHTDCVQPGQHVKASFNLFPKCTHQFGRHYLKYSFFIFKVWLQTLQGCSYLVIFLDSISKRFGENKFRMILATSPSQSERTYLPFLSVYLPEQWLHQGRACDLWKYESCFTLQIGS